MLYVNSTATPMRDDDGDEPMWFATEEYARESAQNNSIGKAYGYEIFCMGEGEY